VVVTGPPNRSSKPTDDGGAVVVGCTSSPTKSNRAPLPAAVLEGTAGGVVSRPPSKSSNSDC